jgi:amino acid adenylation domain-containing protein
MSTTETKAKKAALNAKRRALMGAMLGGESNGGAGAIKRRGGAGAACPLSFAQQRLWFLNQLEQESAFYNVPTAVALSGPLDVEALGRSLREMVRRHEVLRTSFQVVGGEPVQVVTPADEFELALPVYDLTHLAEFERETELKRRAREEGQKPFDLTRAPLLRTTLLRLSEEEHTLLLTVHHIASDDWSTGIFFRELHALYEAYTAGRESPLEELPVQYADYAVWQRGRLQGEALERQLTYWRKQLGGAATLELPTDYARPAVRTYRGELEIFSLSTELSQQLKALCQREGVTLYMLLLAAWQTLLARYSGQEDVVVGSPVAGRPRAETEGLIGFFVNTLVLRTDLSGDPTFGELLKRVREVCLGAYAHQEVPFEKVVEELAPERSLARNPLFQVVFALQNAPGGAEGPELPGLRMRSAGVVDSRNAVFDLTLMMQEGARGLSALVQYSTDLYGRDWVGRVMRHFRTLLEGVCADATRRLSDYELLGADERRQLVEDCNATAAELPSACVHELFERHAASTPEAVALISDGVQMSYGELNEKANRLARLLRKRGVREESRVGLLMERGTTAVVSVLAVLKAGGSYVPLDPEYPQERLGFMLEDSDVRLVLTDEGLGSPLDGVAGVEVLGLSEVGDELAFESGENLPSLTTRDSAAYVIYTSGSTGRPKGVLVTHRSILRLVLSQTFVNFSPSEVFLLLAPLSFDASTFELWGALSSGARLALFPTRRPSLEELGAALGRYGVTTLWLTAGLFHQMAESQPEALAGVRQIVAGGDVLSPAAVRRVLAGRPVGGILVNGYGPTENTTFSCCHPMAAGDEVGEKVSIGSPIANSTAYVLDSRMSPVPVGAPGELYVGGEGLARGYVGRAALTAERFVPHPFSGETGARLYRTGDVARLLSDGRIEFVGRADNQVKVRGYRIELGEVEAALSLHESIGQCVVIVREDEPGDKRLVAYVVAVGAEVSAGELREHLKARLPEYMVPQAFVRLDELPLTTNGKVDRRALPAPDSSTVSSPDSYVAPRDAVEEALCAAWAEVLRVERVGVRDNFFDLGGHSLLATQVVSRVRQALQVELPLRVMFEGPTVEALARHVAAAKGTASTQPPPLTRVGRERELELSYAQQRLWLIEQLEPGAAAYHIPTALSFKGQLDTKSLVAALREIVRRHESLRTRFVAVDGRPAQVIEREVELDVPAFDLTGLEGSERDSRAEELAREEARRPFDLSSAPLIRATLLRLSDEEHVLLLTMHHIVSDGWSMGVLVRELRALYEAFAVGQGSPLEELPVQYADYAVWQRGLLQGEVLEGQLSYWRKQLSGAPEVLEVAGDRARPSAPSYEGAVESVSLPEGLAEGLRELARREGVTLYMLLLAVWQVMLTRYTNQEDVVVGSPVAGRTRAETEGLIGFFVNTLVLRTDLSGDPTFRELLKRVREVCLGAYAHQEVPFEKVVEELAPERHLNRNPLFQVMFILQNESAEAPELPGVSVNSLQPGGTATQFDLTLIAAETGRGLAAALEYQTELFDGARIRRMLGHLQTMLEGVESDPDARLSALPLLTQAEERQSLVEWNSTRVVYGGEERLHRLIELQVGRTPEAVAVRFEGQDLTYRELNARANQLARFLRSCGVGRGERVGVCVERSPEMVVALLGVLKSGGAYVPLDPEYPQERLRFMLEDARVPVLLTQERLTASLPEHGARVVRLDTDWERVSAEGAENLEDDLTGDDLAYVIFTSGSTGRPKGAMNTHRGICNRLLWMQEAYGLSAADRVLQKTPFSFDVSVWEFFWPLMTGARLVVARPGGHRESRYLADLIEQERITTLHFVPSMLSAFLQAEGLRPLPSLKRVVCSGEALTPELQERFFASAIAAELHNLYGPTEAAVDVTYWACERDGEARTVPIGHPIANTQIYLLDPHMRPVPVGAPGELHIGGVNLGRGYLDRPALSAEKFVPNPFSQEPGARLYRTGDLARHLPGGEVEYLGRIDHQVKVRGFRIELGEIESALLAHESVRDCVVLAREDVPGDKRLVAYLVAREEGAPAAGELREYLKGRLPEYMVPQAFVLLAEMPLMPNGKVNRAALRAPEAADNGAGVDGAEPRTPVEARLVEVWAEITGAEEVGIHDNFFDIGGHSLLGMMLVSRVKEVFNVEVSLRVLFEAPTVAEFASALALSLAEEEQNQSIAEFLDKLDQLSEEEVSCLLDKNMAEV